jgi:hypothetical protein
VTLGELVRRVEKFDETGPTDRVRLFAWYLLRQARQERFGVPDIAKCFDDLHLHRPTNVRQLVVQLQGRDFIKDRLGLRGAKEFLERFDGLYLERHETLEVEKLLVDLPARLPSSVQKMYLEEAVTCFRAKAFRAAVVMTWNVAYDHLVETIATKHLSAFNSHAPAAGVGKVKLIANRLDFQRWQESDVIKVANTAAIITKEVAKVFAEKLGKRNSAAHPSGSTFNKLQTEEFISDLIENAMLKL